MPDLQRLGRPLFASLPYPLLAMKRSARDALSRGEQSQSASLRISASRAGAHFAFEGIEPYRKVRGACNECVVGVVLAAGTAACGWADDLRCDNARIQTQVATSASPVALTELAFMAATQPKGCCAHRSANGSQFGGRAAPTLTP